MIEIWMSWVVVVVGDGAFVGGSVTMSTDWMITIISPPHFIIPPTPSVFCAFSFFSVHVFSGIYNAIHRLIMAKSGKGECVPKVFFLIFFFFSRSIKVSFVLFVFLIICISLCIRQMRAYTQIYTLHSCISTYIRIYYYVFLAQVVDQLGICVDKIRQSGGKHQDKVFIFFFSPSPSRLHIFTLHPLYERPLQTFVCEFFFVVAITVHPSICFFFYNFSFCFLSFVSTNTTIIDNCIRLQSCESCCRPKEK